MNTVRALASRARRHAPALVALGVCVAAVALPELALAGSAQGLPWEGPLTKLKDSMTGPVAMVVSLIGVVGCLAGLLWGGEMNEFLRKMIMLVLVISGLVAATSVISNLFNASGAVLAVAGLPGLA